MTTLLLTHPACLDHDNSDGHPESPERLRAILAELKNPDYAGLEWQDAPLATLDQIARVHDRAYIDHILALVPTEGRAELDHETSLTPQSGEAALRAAGALIAAVEGVCNNKFKKRFLRRATARAPCRRAARQRVLPV